MMMMMMWTTLKYSIFQLFSNWNQAIRITLIHPGTHNTGGGAVRQGAGLPIRSNWVMDSMPCLRTFQHVKKRILGLNKKRLSYVNFILNCVIRYLNKMHSTAWNPFRFMSKPWKTAAIQPVKTSVCRYWGDKHSRCNISIAVYSIEILVGLPSTNVW